MARVMCDNTDIEKAQPSMFLLPERGNLMVTCDSQRISRVNLDVFKEESGSTSKQSRDLRNWHPHSLGDLAVRSRRSITKTKLMKFSIRFTALKWRNPKFLLKNCSFPSVQHPHINEMT